jgi:hypothetical protein
LKNALARLEAEGIVGPRQREEAMTNVPIEGVPGFRPE